ncbi:MAG: ABC transporter ATP-binding protein [Cellulosilyticaceae bacterium]
MIEIKNASKGFGNQMILEDICMTIKEGTIHGIIGENGVGKTTLLQMIGGIYSVPQGDILIDGEHPYNNEAVKEKVAYIADRNQFFSWYKVQEIVDFFALSYPSFSKEKFTTYNEQFGLPLNKKISQLSKGMQMRLSLMLGFASCPKYLILDEPTSGLDAVAKKQFFDMLVEAVEEGTTAILSSHHLNEIEKVCDKITMLCDTKIKWEATTSGLKEKVRKLQVVFKDHKPENLESWPEVIEVSSIGSIYYIVTDDYSEAFQEKLKGCDTVLVEELPLTLEEIFIYTSKKHREEERKDA